MTLLEAMSLRVSTRSFSGEPLSPSQIVTINEILEKAGAEARPFGSTIRFTFGNAMINGKHDAMGTYGFISGAAGHIVPSVRRGARAMEDLGYALEKAVLDATAEGFATCWIGGLFSRGKAREIARAGNDELIPAIIAVGKPAAKRRLSDVLVAGTARSRSRKSLHRIAFSVDGNAFPEEWSASLEAVHVAPSASNKQPWRLVYSGRETGRDEAWFLFIDEDRIYNNSLGEVHLQNIDAGIAMRHFQEACDERGLAGSWKPVSSGMGGSATDQALEFGRRQGWTPISRWD